MRAVVCRGYDGEPVLEERESLQPGAGQVLVDVRAAGLNFADALIVRGRYQIKPQLPFVPGSEIAGRVAALGEGTTGLRIGDRVFGFVGLGGFAEQVVTSPRNLWPLPAALGFAQAAAFTQSYATALFALRERTSVRAGETLLVLGAAGGVGRAAIEVGRALGARVIAAAGTPEKVAACLQLGAEAAIDYSREDLKLRARELSGGGMDLVFDNVGGSHAEPALRALREAGRFLVVGFASGEIPRLPLNQVLLRNRSVVGVDWGAWMLRNPDGQRALMGDLLAWVEQGVLQPGEPTAYPLSDAARALSDLLGRRMNGKAVLQIGD